MKKYEILLILPGTLDENEAETKIQEVVGTLKDLTSDVNLSSLGKNRLAYPVKHIRYGYFYIATFSADAEKVEVLKNKLSLSRDLLRAMISGGDKSADTKTITYFGEGRGPRTADKVTFENDLRETVHENVAAEPVKEIVSEEVVEEKSEEKSEIKSEEKAPEKAEAVKVDLKEIDKKLDEILSDDGIISGV